MAELRVLIVDDEPHARARIRELLSRERDVTIVGDAGDGDDAVRQITLHRPSVVFLDVQLPARDGFAVLAALEVPPPVVVFTTAYDSYALRAFDVHALDYLLKPFDRDRLAQSLDRARHAVARLGGTTDSRLTALVEELRAGTRYLTRIAVRIGGKIRIVNSAEIDSVEASGNYVRLHTKGGAHLLRETMQRVEGQLDPAQFARIHRSAIVNLDRIVELEPDFHGDYTVRLTDGRKLPLSRSYRDRFKGRLGPEF
ncbi:MAG: LytTR family DNA-binding domain-containing protein [Gemmatimonadales bacterium]|nr:LytTR family DNA-binding domain-containing protein [Gemmatimonadales bacterium]